MSAVQQEAKVASFDRDENKMMKEIVMNTEESTSRKWTETRELIRSEFGKLTEGCIDSLKGHIELLPKKLEIAYKYSKDQSEKEYQKFKTKLQEA